MVSGSRIRETFKRRKEAETCAGELTARLTG